MCTNKAKQNQLNGKTPVDCKHRSYAFESIYFKKNAWHVVFRTGVFFAVMDLYSLIYVCVYVHVYIFERPSMHVFPWGDLHSS